MEAALRLLCFYPVRFKAYSHIIDVSLTCELSVSDMWHLSDVCSHTSVLRDVSDAKNAIIFLDVELGSNVFNLGKKEEVKI